MSAATAAALGACVTAASASTDTAASVAAVVARLRGHPAFAQLSAEQQDLAQLTPSGLGSGSNIWVRLGGSSRLSVAEWPRACWTATMRAARRALARVKRGLLWHHLAAVETARPNLFSRRVKQRRRRPLRTRLQSGSGRALGARCRRLPRLLLLLECRHSIPRERHSRASVQEGSLRSTCRCWSACRTEPAASSTSWCTA